jgi:nucleoside-diphosphate-sugar epimerase
MRILITGSSGLIGSEAVKFYKGHTIVGIDNNLLLFTKTEYPLSYPINFVHPKYYEAITNHLANR